MPNLNEARLMGRISRDPEVRYIPKGTAVCDLSLAINRMTKMTTDPNRRIGIRRQVKTEIQRRIALAGQLAHAGKVIALTCYFFAFKLLASSAQVGAS